jgi:hypothetical protein
MGITAISCKIDKNTAIVDFGFTSGFFMNRPPLFAQNIYMFSRSASCLYSIPYVREIQQKFPLRGNFPALEN